MKILITGAGGYLGRYMLPSFERAGHELRLMDVQPIEGPHESVVGSVEDLDTVRAAVAGCDALVLAHMAPRKPDSYTAPPVSFAINVTGTANCFHAAVEAGIAKAVLISSVGAVGGHQPPMRRDAPLRPENLYGLTKALQEQVGEYYHRQHDRQVRAQVRGLHGPLQRLSRHRQLRRGLPGAGRHRLRAAVLPEHARGTHRLRCRLHL